MNSQRRLTNDDKVLIKALREEKSFSLTQILREFPNRGWKKSTVAYFLRKLSETGSSDRRPGSGRPKSVRTDENVQTVKELILS